MLARCQSTIAHLVISFQLDSADEQAAAIRRELDGRMQRVAEMERNRKLMPKFVLKEMESLYIEELKSSINLLMANLESLPVLRKFYFTLPPTEI